jgi:hypothetical protein
MLSILKCETTLTLMIYAVLIYSVSRMRLSRPGLAVNSTPFVNTSSENAGDVGSTFRKSLAEKDAKNPTLLSNIFPDPEAETSTLALQDIPLTPVLLLPEAVGSISLGEAFKSMVTLSNDSPVPVGEPRIVVEIQTNTRKVEVARKEPVPKADGGKSVLYSNQHIATVVDWEMQELGMTVLSVTVSYESAVGRREFVRYYKFNVSRSRPDDGCHSCFASTGYGPLGH